VSGGSLLRRAPRSAAALLTGALLSTSATATLAAAASPAPAAMTTAPPQKTPVPTPSPAATPVSSPVVITSPRPTGLPVAPSPTRPTAGGTGREPACGSGRLWLDTPASLRLGDLALTGRDSSITTTVALTVTDMTGSGRGWSLV